MIGCDVVCVPCKDAAHPYEHRACLGAECACRCRDTSPRPQARVLEDVSDHVEADGHCEACGYRWPCPDVRVLPRALDPFERELAEMVDVGWTVEERLPEGVDRAGRRGIVVAATDDEWGKLAEVKVMEFHHGKPRLFTLAAADIEPARCEFPNSDSNRRAYRRLAARVGAATGVADGFEVEDLKLALTLALLAT